MGPELQADRVAMRKLGVEGGQDGFRTLVCVYQISLSLNTRTSSLLEAPACETDE